MDNKMVCIVFVLVVLVEKEYVYLIHNDLIIMTDSLKLQCVRQVEISIIIHEYLPSFFAKKDFPHYPRCLLHGIKFFFQD